ncbi:MAG TPA: alpha/beta hydrolase [Acholeplasmataceae bacterium]|nr:alpha/beta hydrolase [Acholeplasmataceae bacterium]
MKCVILIHGFLSDHHDLDSIKPALENIYDHIECIDLPGHGIHYKKERFNVDKVLDFINNLYKKLEKDYDEIDCIGYSMGGALALYLASKQKIRKLILLAPACKYLNFLFPYKRLKTYLHTKKALSKSMSGNIKESLKEKLKNIHKDDLIALKFLKDRYFTIKFPAYFIEFRKLIKNINSSIENISTPTLLLYGHIDQIIPEKAIEFVYNVCENVKTIIYSDISHLMLLSKDCGKIVDDILDFIKD